MESTLLNLGRLTTTASSTAAASLARNATTAAAASSSVLAQVHSQSQPALLQSQPASPSDSLPSGQHRHLHVHHKHATSSSHHHHAARHMNHSHPDLQSHAATASVSAATNDAKRPLRWSRSMHLTVPLYRHALGQCRNSVRSARAVVAFIKPATPKNVSIEHTLIPRRADVLKLLPGGHSAAAVDGPCASDSDGHVKAEWLTWTEPEAADHQTDATAPPTPLSDKIVLYIHGGAFVMSSAEGHRPITWRVAQQCNARVLSVDYRLAPEHPFPYPLQDVISAYLHLIDPPAASDGTPATPVRPDQIVVMGDSAGGGLAISLALWLRDNGFPLPAALVGLSPWLDLTHSQPSFRLNTNDYLPLHSADPAWIVPNKRSHYYTTHDSLNTHPLVSPLFARDLAARPLPPMLLHIGEQERLRDETLLFATKTVRHSPVRVEVFDDQVHVFQAFAGLGEEAANHSLARIGDFVKSLASPMPPSTDTTPHASSDGHSRTPAAAVPLESMAEIVRITADKEVVDIGIQGARDMVDNGRRQLEDTARLMASTAQSSSNGHRTSDPTVGHGRTPPKRMSFASLFPFMQTVGKPISSAAAMSVATLPFHRLV
ncbi:Alpha/Beta hydrolase protein [Entophlyctis helioformis]|nr:Alpha/Beta hydrolase protein [Entophlyctis helioformis]